MVHFLVCDSCLGQLECAWVVWLVVALAVCATGWHSVWPFEAVSLRDRSLTHWGTLSLLHQLSGFSHKTPNSNGP